MNLTFKAILCSFFLGPRSTAVLITRCVQFDACFAKALYTTNLSNPLPSSYFPLNETVWVEYEHTAHYNYFSHSLTRSLHALCLGLDF